MAFTQEQVQTLEQAIAEGTLRVKYGDTEVTYQGLSEMRALLRQMRAELASAQGGGRRRRSGLIRLTQTRSGL